MHSSETSCRVRLLGPMQDCVSPEAFAEMVMIALMKSPAEVCVAAGYSLDRYWSSDGMRSWLCSHCERI